MKYIRKKEEIMKLLTKTIAYGIAAFALYACSNENTTAPEHPLPQAHGSNENYQLVSGNLPDETKETLGSWLQGNSLSKMIAVDHWCVENPDYPDNQWWCLPPRIQLESGTVSKFYLGTSDRISCELAQDTLTYSGHISSDDSTATKTLSRNLVNYISDIAEEFRDSCETEGGTFIENNEGAMECEVKLKPWDCETCPEGITPLYSDPNWSFFAQKAIEPCRTMSAKRP